MVVDLVVAGAICKLVEAAAVEASALVVVGRRQAPAVAVVAGCRLAVVVENYAEVDAEEGYRQVVAEAGYI